ncbi:MAG TPA: hypothetical protein VHF87_05780 [Methylomirabilota bacterium]|nr:hypothetical protein [Methylomirabilota bacterium]
MRGFLAGFVTGGLIVWFFRDDIQTYLDEQARLARVRTADRLHAVEETAERAFDRASAPIRKAEEMLDHGRAQVSDTLRAAERTIRP